MEQQRGQALVLYQFLVCGSVSARQRKYLRRGMEKFADQIRPAITREINDNEFSAFLSLAYNIGPSAFKKSTALRRFNAGNKIGAADAILWFNKAGGKTLRGLTNRRNDERALFLHPVKKGRAEELA